ncbi:hypothetical protein, no similarity [Maudiozyma saulgeensis]|uniref:Uncharacterized protein n=1 Tax=Maudiozyma saulgeensis TaxID=1789683 RepID=A0A1X7QXJ2_9SACH|nr:hypothetical protein, no similarity [Kazachstania saulgeensis]
MCDKDNGRVIVQNQEQAVLNNSTTRLLSDTNSWDSKFIEISESKTKRNPKTYTFIDIKHLPPRYSQIIKNQSKYIRKYRSLYLKKIEDSEKLGYQIVSQCDVCHKIPEDLSNMRKHMNRHPTIALSNFFLARTMKRDIFRCLTIKQAISKSDFGEMTSIRKTFIDSSSTIWINILFLFPPLKMKVTKYS